jgi:O-antigen biosynthesis protein WbqP
MKRLFDLIVILVLATIFALPMLLISLIIRLTSKGSYLYWSTRIGQNNKPFSMPKFRTMKINTPVLATDRLEDPKSFYTPFGRFLRKSSLDELPQIWVILKGDMTLVGPRPALFNQKELIDLRTTKGIHKLKPGLTGWAQVNGRDKISIKRKVDLDSEYLSSQSFNFDLYILFLTFLKMIKGEGIDH